LFFGFKQLQGAFSVFSGTLEEAIDLTEESACHRRRAVVDVASNRVADVLAWSRRDSVESADMRAHMDVLIGGQKTTDHYATKLLAG